MNKKGNKSDSDGWRGAAAALALALLVPALVIGQGQFTAEMDIAVTADGCPDRVSDRSDSCAKLGHAGDAGPGNACARAGASVLRWSSANGAEFTISFEGETPLGGSLDRTSHNGALVAPVPASANPGQYKYDVIMINKDHCPLDPRIIITD